MKVFNFFCLLLFCLDGVELATCSNQTSVTKVLDFLFVHNYCIQERLDPWLVFNDVNATVLSLDPALKGVNGVDWVLRISEGDNQLSPVDAILDYLLRTNEQTRDFLAIITAGCTQDVQYIAEISGSSIFDGALLTYAFSELSTLHLLRPNHFRLVPSELHLATGIASIIEEYCWKRIVLITQPLSVFHSISTQLNELLNVSIENVEFLEPEKKLFFPEDHRIFVLNMYPGHAATILCQAYLQGMLFPDYVWITYRWYYTDWWMDVSSDCTASQIVSVLIGSIAVSHYPHSRKDNLGLSVYSRLAADAVLSLVNTLNMNNSHGQISPELIKVAQFIGLSGPVSFESDTNSRTLDHISIYQYNWTTLPLDKSFLIDDGLVPIGYVQVSNSNHSFMYENGLSINDVWNGGDIPADGTPVTEFKYPLLSLMVVNYSAACIGIIFAIVCFIFNILFRRRKLIRLTSPTINYIIIMGTVIFYLSVFTFFYLPGTSIDTLVIICNFRMWLTSIGFSLCYVPINVKMWRVYHISRKPSLNKTLIKDWHLMLCILLFVVIDLIILGIVTSIDGSRYSFLVIRDKESPGTFVNKDGLTSSYAIKRCYSGTEVYWLPVVFGYKFLLQAIGVYLAFSIRKVKIKGLNDSREVSITLYITSIILFVIVLVTFIFGDYINVDGAVYGLGISTASTIVLVFLFLPKMYGLYKDPHGENIFMTKSVINSGTVKSSSQLGVSLGAKVIASDVNATSPWKDINPSELSLDSSEERQSYVVKESSMSENKAENVL